ncbi:MAG: GlsB/YeaQ/YmgE family stress response membrane protein [Actinomycetes bacterium]
MQIDGIISGLFAAVVVGVVARLLVRGYQPIGCLLTLLIGLVGAGAGAWIGNALNWGWLLTFGVQILIGALLVLPFTAATRDRF